VRRRLDAGGTEKRPTGSEGFQADGDFLAFKVNLDTAAFGRLWISVTSIDTKLETT
jgi:hypothetical protein